MRATWLGWAGVELEADGEALVLDVLRDPAALYAWLGEAGRDAPLPAVVPPTSKRSAIAGLVTHLHRDHADAGALAAAIKPGAPVLGPAPSSGTKLENLGLAQATAELSSAGLAVEPLEPWGQQELGPFRIVALPAVDGSGDPQVSWLVEADGVRVLHLGDTMFHGYWWRFAQRFGPIDIAFLPINGAAINFPHRRPASPMAAVMDPEQAVIAAEALAARTVVPIHFGGFELEPHYRPAPDAYERFVAAASGSDFTVHQPSLGEPRDHLGH